jgi:hypothetical protein
MLRPTPQLFLLFSPLSEFLKTDQNCEKLKGTAFLSLDVFSKNINGYSLFLAIINHFFKFDNNWREPLHFWPFFDTFWIFQKVTKNSEKVNGLALLTLQIYTKTRGHNRKNVTANPLTFYPFLAIISIFEKVSKNGKG